MKIIAITGMPGAGKSEAQKVIRELTDAPVLVMRQAVEDELRSKGLPLTNESLRNYATELRKKHGMDIVAKMCVPYIAKLKAGTVIIDGIRSPDEVRFFKRTYGNDFMLIAVHAPPEVRFNRLKSRGETWDMQDVDGFRWRDRKELDWGLGEAIAIADYNITNEGTLDGLRKSVAEFIKTNLNATHKGKGKEGVSEMQVIGLMGPIGAGKGAVSEYLHDKYGFEVVAMGDLVREEVVEAGMEIDRDSTDKLSKARTDKFGPDYWLNKAANRISSSESKRMIIDGLRYPHDVEFFRKRFGDRMTFILVDADPMVRFERMKTRGRPGFPDTLTKFKNEEKRQDELFEVSKAFAMAEHRIDNSGDYDRLYEQLEQLAKLLNLD